MPRLDPQATIMIVDDEPENLHVLHEILKSRKHRVVAFPSGELALKAAVAAPPDVVLLDIRMPVMDGYEVCRRFKADKKLRDIPILFLSALTGSSEKIDAFAAGAVDYLEKPIYEVEVLARVETHLRLRRYAVGLENLVQERTAALVESNRRLKILDDAKTDWLSMLSHELRTPLTGVLGISELLFSEISLNSKWHDLKPVFETSRKRIQDLVDGAELLNKVALVPETFKVRAMPLWPVVAKAVHEVESETHVPCACDCQGELEGIQVDAEENLLHRAIGGLLYSATCCIGVRGRVTVSVEVLAGVVRLAFRTDGMSLKPKTVDTFFEVFGRRESLIAGGDFGLRPALSRRILRIFGGDAVVRTLEPKGFEIAVTLPVNVEEPVHVS